MRAPQWRHGNSANTVRPSQVLLGQRCWIGQPLKVCCRTGVWIRGWRRTHTQTHTKRGALREVSAHSWRWRDAACPDVEAPNRVEALDAF